MKYFNEYGCFSDDGKEYQIKINKNNKLPMVWSNILTNGNFGTLVTESMGGYTWYKNSRLNKITAWSNDPILDTPSEIIYFKDEEEKNIWTLGANPIQDENDYYITYGFGYSKYSHISNGIIQDLEVYVPTKDNVKVNILHLKNTYPKKKKIKLVYYIKPVLDEDELKSEGYINTKFDKNCNIICAQNLSNEIFDDYLYITSSEKIDSFTGIKDDFLGSGTLSFPSSLNFTKLNNESALKRKNIIAIQLNIELEAFENKDISIIMGIGKNEMECKDIAYKYANVNNCIQEYGTTKRYWNALLSKIQVKTPVESIDILLNGWLMYQTLASRMWGRTGFYQCGGAYGFRDQLQDCISIKYINSQITKSQIIKHSKHQFEEGDVEHWWHEETGRGIRTRFSDDLLWLPYVTADYINFTNDYNILEEKTNYLSGKTLDNGIDEKYDLYLKSDKEENIYNHCIKAIEKSLKFGKNGLPLIGSGDWNDGFSTVGNKGKGESVWLGFFLGDVLNKFIPICEYKGENELAEKYKKISENLKKALNNFGWDGRWFRRAFMDDESVLGSLQNEECRIDSIAQSWSIISNMADNDKKYISLESLENHLVDKENGIIKLLDPPFDKGNIEPGYIKSYLPGTRENGGQYTHAAIWAIIAEAILGFGDKACELLRMINPIEHSKTKEQSEKYKVEPYVVAADVYGQGNLAGRGGWTWYTGSSSWMYEAIIKYILGLRVENGYLKMEPCISKNWKEYSIRYKFGESIYNIKIENVSGNSTGVNKFILNGVEIIEKKVKLYDDGNINSIEIIM